MWSAKFNAAVEQHAQLAGVRQIARVRRFGTGDGASVPRDAALVGISLDRSVRIQVFAADVPAIWRRSASRYMRPPISARGRTRRDGVAGDLSCDAFNQRVAVTACMHEFNSRCMYWLLASYQCGFGEQASTSRRSAFAAWGAGGRRWTGRNGKICGVQLPKSEFTCGMTARGPPVSPCGHRSGHGLDEGFGIPRFVRDPSFRSIYA